MRRAMTAAVLAAALVVAVQAQGGANAGADDLKKLQGTWKLVEVDGKAVGGEEAKARLVIEGKRLTMFVDKTKITEGDFKLDASKKPKHIDVAPEKGGATKGTSL